MRLLHHSLTALAAAAVLAAGASAMAQTAAIPDASAEQLASAFAEADGLIASTGSPELFENISSEGMPKVRHKASGLVCIFMPGAENNTLVVFPGDDLPLGDDVGCNADMGRAYVTYYATRYGPGYSPRDSVNDAVVAIQDRFPDARPYEGTVASISPPEGVTETAFAALLVGPEDSVRYTHALAAKVGEWIFKQRMTGDGAESSIMANQVVTGALWNDLLQAAVKRPG